MQTSTRVRSRRKPMPFVGRERVLILAGIVMFAAIVAMIVLAIVIFSPGLSILVFVPACLGFGAIAWARSLRAERAAAQPYVPEDYPG